MSAAIEDVALGVRCRVCAFVGRWGLLGCCQVWCMFSMLLFVCVCAVSVAFHVFVLSVLYMCGFICLRVVRVTFRLFVLSVLYVSDLSVFIVRGCACCQYWWTRVCVVKSVVSVLSVSFFSWVSCLGDGNSLVSHTKGLPILVAKKVVEAENISLFSPLRKVSFIDLFLHFSLSGDRNLLLRSSEARIACICSSHA